uniref:Formylglycine-generating enzyme, required for sulfatase activity, contains SUMF1/FGE domain n=1 Tax=Candidatus Kentrum sp. SD TaxID=2126332 RepID=A0A451BJY4_9GAMM|nr:MAG: Formylglycine-generating enzyme, required for sulfatase activity, contains SUMF1/FGE domain [Candidatus Kentron sp. SD]
MPELTFASTEWVKPLSRKLLPLERKLAFGIQDEQTEELREIGDTFGLSFFDLTKYYIPLYCQDHDPTDHAEEGEPISDVKIPVFSAINAFLKGNRQPSNNGDRQMFVLSGAGMGKTSLLVMIKLSHITAFWPRGYHCLLLKIGEDTLARVAEQADQANTVLLLDALDEDPLAWGNTRERLLAIIAATGNYYRVIISCHPRLLLEVDSDIFDGSGRIRIDRHICPMIFLAPFDDGQVSRYLARRYPDHWRDRILRRGNFMHWRARRLTSEMGSLRFQPLLLSHIHDILALGEAGIRSYDLYAFYQTLVRTWLARQESKLHRRIANPPNRETLWKICATLAVFLQSKREWPLSLTALHRLTEEFPMLANLEYFDVGGNSLLKRISDGGFRFSHNSIREFLVAYSVLNGEADIIGDGIRVTPRLLTFLKARDRTEFAFPRQFGERTCPAIPELHFYDMLKDSQHGPRMQLIPAGEFLMGSRAGKGYKDEYPQHRVRITTPFALGTWAVTFTEYDHFCEVTGRGKPADEGWGREGRPVINVSWRDALDYCAWLSEETGERYRLPSEAQWEYAIRAGTETNYWWGDEFRGNMANCVGCESQWDDKKTAPVGSFAPNSFGLFDMGGNVCEWLADCWHSNYQGAPVDERVWERENPGDCVWRVTRGGSWIGSAWYLRSASRFWFSSDVANFNVGFRVVREI